MITYSRHDMERQLVADQGLWRRMPVAASDFLWPAEIALLGWATGWWTGLATVAILAVAAVALPPRLRVSIYLIDLLDRALRLPLRLSWLLLVGHLWLREPIFPILGQPLAGAVAVALGLFLLTRLLALLARLVARRALRG